MNWQRIGITIPVYLPGWLHRPLRRWKRRGVASGKPGRAQAVRKNLLGDRDIEWSWIAAHMPSGPGSALDFGTGRSVNGLIAARKGYRVIAVDLEPVHWFYHHPLLEFARGDIQHLSLDKEHFDLVINCSAIEHVGLAGRYGVTGDQPDGDLAAMGRLRDLIRPGGIMLLTIPVGLDAVFPPMCRVYGEQRLPRLLAGFSLKKEEFWVKDEQNRWLQCDRSTALRFPADAGSWEAEKNITALGCFVLEKPL